jgi:hypothetical protein
MPWFLIVPCLGYQQFFKRRKPDADCYVGEKFQEPESHEENCPCTDEDFEWFVLLSIFDIDTYTSG